MLKHELVQCITHRPFFLSPHIHTAKKAFKKLTFSLTPLSKVRAVAHRDKKKVDSFLTQKELGERLFSLQQYGLCTQIPSKIQRRMSEKILEIFDINIINHLCKEKSILQRNKLERNGNKWISKIV